MTERSVAVRLIALNQQYDDAMKASGRNTADLGTQTQLLGAKSASASRDVDNLGNSVQAADRKAQSAKPSFSALGISIAAIGPALIPIAGLALAGTAALGGMGVAGILAFGGIKAQMADGTVLGNVYRAQLTSLKDDLTALQTTAANGVLGPFQRAVADTRQNMPFLNASIATFSTLAGKSAVDLEEGLVADLRVMMPMLTEVGADVVKLFDKFDTWSQNGGAQKFSNWAEENLPTIEHDLGLVTSAIGKLLDGLGPLGQLSLSELGLVARAINALPLPVLQALVPLLVEGYLAFKAFEGVKSAASAISGVTSKLYDSAAAAKVQAAASKATAASMVADSAAIDAAARVQAATMAQTAAEYQAALASEASDVALTAEAYIVASAEVVAAQEAEAVAMVAAADAAKAAQLATSASSTAAGLAGSAGFGPLGLAVGAVTVGLGLGIKALFDHQAAAAKDRAAVNDLTNAFQQSNGVIDSNITLMTAQKLQSSGALDAGAKLGLSADTLTQAALGNAAAMNTVKSATDGATAANAAAAVTYESSKHHLVEYNPELQALAKAADKVSSSVGGSNKDLDAAQKKYQQLQNALSGIVPTSNAATDSIDATSAATATATDKATAYLAVLTDLSTTDGGDVVRSQDALQSQLNAVANTLHTGKGAFDQYTAAGLSSRDSIDQAATAAQNYAAQVFKQTGSISAAEDAYNGWYNALVKTAGAQGVSKQQLDAYLESVGQLPSQVDVAMAKTTDAMTTALAAGLQQGLAPLEKDLQDLVAAMGYSAAGTAVSTGNFLGAQIAHGLSSGMNGALASAAQPASQYGPGGEYLGNGPTYFDPSTYKANPGATSPTLKSGIVTPSAPSTGLTAAQKAVVAHDDLLAAQALAAISPTNKLALAQAAVADATRRLNNETTKGTTDYYTALTKLHQAQSDLAAEQLSEAKAVSDAQKQLATDTAAETKLLQQEAQTTTQFYADLSAAAAAHAAKDNQLLAGRTTALEGWASASTKATVQWGSSLTWLTGNVEDQVDQFNQWMTLLAQARANGVSDAVISALGLDQGPQALGQLEQFATATKAQIDALNTAVAAKNAAAGQETATEAANNYGDLGQALLAEQQSYADAVVALQTRFASDMATLAQQVNAALATMKTDQATLNALPGAPIVTASGGGAAAPSSSGTYHQIADPAALKALPAGTPLYTKSATGTYSQIPNPTALKALPTGTPIYDKTFDSGGFLQPGFTVAYNGTGKPEHVYTDEQLAAMGGSPTVHVYLGNREITDIVKVEMSNNNRARKTAIALAGVNR